MSIVRVGMAEDGKFADGWDAIFNKKAGVKKEPAAKKAEVKPPAKAAKKPARKK